MRNILLFLFTSLLLLSCASSVKDETTRKTGEKAIFTNQTVDIRGRTVGVGGRYRRIYLSAFGDYIGNYDFRKMFEQYLKEQLNQYGLLLAGEIRTSEAIIDGSLDNLFITTAERATNAPGMIYTLMLTYSVSERSKNYIQLNRPILEEMLVFDTNAYQSNDVLPLLLRNAARHTAEAVYYGWQMEYSKTHDKIETLGAPLETNNSLNRAK